MIKYKILGPISLRHKTNARGAKFIEKAGGLDCLDHHGIARLRGCYVFCVTAGHGAINPFYVGKSGKSFAQECFTADKINKFNAVLHRVTHGKPVMLFVVPEHSKGKFNSKALSALEQYLIGLAYQVNDDIQNVQGIPKPAFEIIGVQAPKKGPKGKPLQAFCKAFDV